MNRIVIDADSTKAGAKQASGHDEGRYESVGVDADGPILYRKWVSPNPLVADFIPNKDYPWVEEYTDVPQNIKALSPRMFVKDGDEERPLGLEDGLILVFHGTPHREVAILQNGQILSDEEAELREEQIQKELPRYTEWGFRLHKITYTDGPKDRDNLSAAAQSKRNKAEEAMFRKQEEFFTALAEKFGSADPQSKDESPSSPADLVKLARSLPEDEREAMVKFLLKELEK